MKKKFNPIFPIKSVFLKLPTLAMAMVLASPTVFAAPGLTDIYQMAAAHDAKLAQAKATYEANQQAKKIARSPLLPQINATANYVQNNSSVASGDVTTQTLAVELTQSLYRRDNWTRYDQADFQLKKAHFDLKLAEQDMIVRVADAYFKVLLAQEDMSLAQAKTEADKTQWERANASAEVGLASKTDVLQAKSTYDLSQSQLILAQNNLDVAYEELVKLTGRSVDALKTIRLNKTLPKQTLDMAEWEQLALDHNLQVQQVSQQTQIAAKEIETQKSGHWVSVDFKAQYSNLAYTDFNASYPGQYDDRNNFSMGIYASMPLYSGGGTSAKVAEARSNYKAATAGLRDAKESARINARIQVRNVLRGMELVQANRAAVKSNDAFLEAAEEGYKVGLKNLLEVLTARTNRFQARRNLAESLHNVVLSRLKLEAAVGQLNAQSLDEFDQLLSDPTNAVLQSL